MKKWILILPYVLLAFVACAPAAEPESDSMAVVSATVVPEPTDLPQVVETVLPPTAVSSPPTAIPTNQPPPEPTAIPTEEPLAETAVIAGRTDEGAFFLGAVDAPVTMIDYSDFL